MLIKFDAEVVRVFAVLCTTSQVFAEQDPWDGKSEEAHYVAKRSVDSKRGVLGRWRRQWP